ncbi:hypothetical protein XELAEV_18028803mg [Xenopus laevis]|uniref:Uncharacterized protein n=1 Tax=Xenopus laevis TaxID=8355 RepID=A0A974CQD5_XENLA|nr:hypothetical protein XELAEV_18028803mg [Xenopus laevis]
MPHSVLSVVQRRFQQELEADLWCQCSYGPCSLSHCCNGSRPTRSPSAGGGESGSVPCKAAVWQVEKEDLEGGADVFRGDRGYLGVLLHSLLGQPVTRSRSCAHPLQLCISLALRSYRQNYKSHHASVPSAGQLLRKRYRQWDAGTCSQLDAESAGREPLQQ